MPPEVSTRPFVTTRRRARTIRDIRGSALPFSVALDIKATPAAMVLRTRHSELLALPRCIQVALTRRSSLSRSLRLILTLTLAERERDNMALAVARIVACLRLGAFGAFTLRAGGKH